MIKTATPFPSGLLKSSLPAIDVLTPNVKNTKRIVPVVLGPFPAASATGNLVTGLDLKKFAPRGGTIRGVRVIWTTAGGNAGAAGDLNLELDTTNLTGGVVNTTLATSTLGTVTEGSAITGGNTFGASTGILDVEWTAGGTPYNAGAFQVQIDVEANEDTAVQVGTFGSTIIARPGLLQAVVAKLDVCGSANSTTVRVRKNGTPITDASVTFAHDASDPKTLVIPCGDTELVAGDVIDFEVTAAATGALGLTMIPLVHQPFTV